MVGIGDLFHFAEARQILRRSHAEAIHPRQHNGGKAVLGRGTDQIERRLQFLVGLEA